MSASASSESLVLPPHRAELAAARLSLPSVHLQVAGLPGHVADDGAAILTAAGLRLAEDDAVPLGVGVAPPAVVEAAGAPPAAAAEFFQLTVESGAITLAAGGPQGALWGLRTLADLCDRSAAPATVPLGQVVDWPDLAHRGLFIEDKWGPDRMTLDDWRLLVDRLARLRMNTLGIGLYGCWAGCRYEGQPTEFLMVPVPGHPELRTEKRLRWYSPAAAAWQRDQYLPRLFAGDFLGKIVAYGRRRGVTVVPFVNSLGHNTMIPRLCPAVSAKDADGAPRRIGYCLSAPETRRFIADFYGSVLERYYPDGADLFHIQLDEVWPEYADPDDPHGRVDPWCACPACAAREREENLQDYVIWLVRTLIDRGVGRVVMWNDQLTRHMDALDSGFAARLAEAGLTDRLVLHWWWYSNEALNDRTRVGIGRKLGLAGWVAPMTCYFNWERYSPTLKNIELMLAMCRDEGGEGAVAYSVHDPAWADHEMLLASYAWNGGGVPSPDAQFERWARVRFGAAAAAFAEATGLLRRATACAPLARCYYYRYSYCQEQGPWPRPYPGEPLAALEQLDGDPAAQLRRAAVEAQLAEAAFQGVAAGGDLDRDAVSGARSLVGVAARIRGLAVTFAWLVDLRAAAAGDSVDASWAQSCAAQRRHLVGAMAVMEEHMPAWLVPAALMGLSPLLAFLEQLEGDLGQVAAGGLPPGDLRWTADWVV